MLSFPYKYWLNIVEAIDQYTIDFDYCRPLIDRALYFRILVNHDIALEVQETLERGYVYSVASTDIAEVLVLA
jgi:hypothetical protein